MGVATSEPSALDQLAAARVRGAKPDELLELAEAAIDQATAAGDAQTVESVAEELDVAAPTYPEWEGGHRLRLAADRARATSQQPPPAPEDVPATAKAAFWVTLAIATLTLFSIGAVGALGDVDASYLILFLAALAVVIGGLFVAATGAVGFVQSRRAGSRKGMLMSAVPLAVVLFLIAVRISLSLF
jgi:hypothetical protein